MSLFSSSPQAVIYRGRFSTESYLKKRSPGFGGAWRHPKASSLWYSHPRKKNVLEIWFTHGVSSVFTWEITLPAAYISWLSLYGDLQPNHTERELDSPRYCRVVYADKLRANEVSISVFIVYLLDSVYGFGDSRFHVPEICIPRPLFSSAKSNNGISTFPPTFGLWSLGSLRHWNLERTPVLLNNYSPRISVITIIERLLLTAWSWVKSLGKKV